MYDITDTLAANSDQLNADDLLGGPVTVEILSAGPGPSDAQPVELGITDHQPWRPSKTCRRHLAMAWGSDASLWVGRSVRLYREPSVKWAGKPVGGIMIQAMSGIPKSFDAPVRISRKERTAMRIDVLTVEPFAGLPFTAQQLDAWHRAEHGRGIDDLDAATKRELRAYLGANPQVAASIAAKEAG